MSGFINLYKRASGGAPPKTNSAVTVSTTSEARADFNFFTFHKLASSACVCTCLYLLGCFPNTPKKKPTEHYCVQWVYFAYTFIPHY